MYLITFERGGKVVTSLSIEALTGAATIARLAFIAEMDLAASAVQSAVVPVRSGDREADLVITMRPGAGLRADIMVLGKQKHQPADRPVALLTGDVIGNYRILEPLGEGG